MRILKRLLLLMAVIATENFTGASGNLPNPPWTAQAAGGATVSRDGSGKFTQSALDGTDAFAFWNQDVFPANHYSQITLGPLAASGQWYKVLARAKDTGSAAFDNYDFFTDGSTGAGHSQIQKWVNGAPTTIANIAATFANGDTIKIAAVGNQIFCYKNGALIAGPFTDSSLTTGSAGIGCSVNAGGTLAGDDFEGGSVESAYGFQPLVDKPLTLLRCRPLGPGNPLREVRYYDIPAAAATGTTIVPDVGLLQLDGFSPALGLPITLVPGQGQLDLTGFAVTLPRQVTPGTGALQLDGFGPSIGLPRTVVPGFGQLTLNGFSPQFAKTVIPGSGALTLNGFSPAIGLPKTIVPGFGQLVLDGFAASFTFVSGGYTAQPGSGALTLTGFGPAIGLPRTIVPGSGSLGLTGAAPAIGLPITVRPDSGLLTLSGFGPTVFFTPPGITLVPGTGQLVLTGYAPWIGTFTFRIMGGPVMAASITGSGVMVASVTGGPTLTSSLSGGPV